MHAPTLPSRQVRITSTQSPGWITRAAGATRPVSGETSLTAAGRRASDTLALVGEVIDQHVLAEMVGAGVERATAVDLRHLFDECAQARRVVEHEGVDDDAFAGDALDFLERLLRRAHA